MLLTTPNDTEFVDIHSFPLAQQSALLLCSDGLTDQVAASDIRLLVEQHAGDPEKAARALVDAANEAGGKDNVTVVVLIETEDYARLSAAREPVQRLRGNSWLDLVFPWPACRICRVPVCKAVLGGLHLGTEAPVWKSDIRREAGRSGQMEFPRSQLPWTSPAPETRSKLVPVNTTKISICGAVFLS